MMEYGEERKKNQDISKLSRPRNNDCARATDRRSEKEIKDEMKFGVRERERRETAVLYIYIYI
jgi:hypothetical protein